jgi:hypothetical protein
VKQSYETRRCTVDEDPDFQRAPATLNPGFIKETLRKWLKKQSKTIINDILPKHAKLLHLDETDFRTAMSKGDNIPVCPEIFNESEIMERVSDDRSKMRAVFYLALWSCISHTNYIIIVSMLGNAETRLRNWANSASSPEMDDIDYIVWNLVWGYYKCSSALATFAFVYSRCCTGVGEVKVFFISSGLMSACTIIKHLLLISSKDLHKTSFLYSDLSMAGDEKSSLYYHYFGRNCLPLITSTLILLVRRYVQNSVSKGINSSSLRKEEIAGMLCGKQCAKADYQTQVFFVGFLVNFKDSLYWNHILLPKIKEIRKQAETSSSPEGYEVIPQHIATESIYSRGGTSNSNKEDLNVHTRLPKGHQDIEEVCESVKSRSNEDNSNKSFHLLDKKTKDKTDDGIKRRKNTKKKQSEQNIGNFRESVKKSKGATTSGNMKDNSNESSAHLLYKKTNAKTDDGIKIMDTKKKAE